MAASRYLRFFVGQVFRPFTTSFCRAERTIKRTAPLSVSIGMAAEGEESRVGSTAPNLARCRSGCQVALVALLPIDQRMCSGYGSRDMPDIEKSTVVFSLTNELFLPSRLVDRVSDRALIFCC